MNAKIALLASIGLFAGGSSSPGAGVIINNLVNGPISPTWEGDMLYANSDGTLMDGGLVTMGYFPSQVTTADLDTIGELIAHLATFTMITSAVPGSPNYALGTANPGYVDQTDFTSIGLIGQEHPLRGRMLYSIITSASNLGSANASAQYALVAIGSLWLDEPLENQYSSNPLGLYPIIGTLKSFVGDAGVGTGIYQTLNMAVVPEPFIWQYACLGVLGLMRRYRKGNMECLLGLNRYHLYCINPFKPEFSK